MTALLTLGGAHAAFGARALAGLRSARPPPQRSAWSVVVRRTYRRGGRARDAGTAHRPADVGTARALVARELLATRGATEGGVRLPLRSAAGEPRARVLEARVVGAAVAVPAAEVRESCRARVRARGIGATAFGRGAGRGFGRGTGATAFGRGGQGGRAPFASSPSHRSSRPSGASRCP